MAKKSARQAALDEYNQLRHEITERVKRIGVNRLVPMTGKRNYHLEADGSLYLEEGANRVPVPQWDAREWQVFGQLCIHGLWKKLAAEGMHHDEKEEV